MNLKTETLEAMERCGKTVEDIDWIGGKDFAIPVDVFFELADVEYDSGFGSAEVALDLRVVFKDGSALYRHEYDGAEWWKFLDLKKPVDIRSDVALTYNEARKKVDDPWNYWFDTYSLKILNTLSRY